jgi:putative phage-type endonuclease
MSTIVKLVQGSPEWHEHRQHHRNASETPAVLGLSPWTTPYQLWQIKTGRTPQPDITAAMAHGTQMEPLAREAYEKLTGHVMQPLVLVDGEYSASLDGITLDGMLVLEVKCPKSKESKILSEAKAGRVPVDIYDGTVGILLEQQRKSFTTGSSRSCGGSPILVKNHGTRGMRLSCVGSRNSRTRRPPKKMFPSFDGWTRTWAAKS